VGLIKNADKLEQGYEKVLTVTDYYDGPRQGIANYQGTPHFYKCIFDEDKDDYSDLYRLTPLDERTFQLAMEDWEIWLRWERAFHAAQTDIATHPALPQDAARHKELHAILEQELGTNADKAIIRMGKFDVLENPIPPKGAPRTLVVEWRQP